MRLNFNRAFVGKRSESMGKRAQSSSQCSWHHPVDPSKIDKLIKGLDPVKSATIISQGDCTPSKTSRTEKISATLKEIIALNAPAAISIANNETRDSFLVRDNMVILSLTPESFASYGLDGQKFGDRYFVKYELTTPGKRIERLEWALKTTITSKHEFIVWHSEREELELGQTSMIMDIAVPSLLPPVDSEEFADWSNAFIEWIGLAVLNPKLLSRNNGGTDAAICDYFQPEGAQQMPVSIATQFKNGLRAGSLEEIWNAKQSEPWVVIHVEGFANTPAAWIENAPHQVGRELGYTIVKKGTSIGYFKFA